MEPLVCIIVLNWNGFHDTVECIESLKQIIYKNYIIIIVDNASKNNEAYRLKEVCNNIDIILSNKNYGYTGGNNIGIEYALSKYDPSYILILNNDIIVDPEFLNHLVYTAQSSSKIGIVGGKVYYKDYPNIIQSAGIGLNMYLGRAFHIGGNKYDNLRYNCTRKVNIIMGCCMLIKSEVIKIIGLFDEEYFCYKDDTDYCVRTSRAGYDVVYTSNAKLWHRNEIKLNIWTQIKDRGKRASLTYYLLSKNNFLFMKKYANKKQMLIFIIYFLTIHFGFQTIICLLYIRDIQRYFAMCKGIKDGIILLFAKQKVFETIKKHYICIT